MRKRKLAQTWYANWKKLLDAHIEYLGRDVERAGNYDKLHGLLFDEIRLIRTKLGDIESALRDLDVQRPSVTRRKIPILLRQEVMREAQYKCVVCSSPDDLTIDHIVPVSVGGSNEKTNLQVMCRPCNSRKGAKL